MKNEAVLYIHGMGGDASESDLFKPLFENSAVTGLDYKTFTPWETGEEIYEAVQKLKEEHGNVTLIANSIGAFFSMNADIGGLIREAYFISPIVDMEKLILGMMRSERIGEEELLRKGTVNTASGVELSYGYLRYVREHPIVWETETHIVYGEYDTFTDIGTMTGFAEKHNADLTVMKGGEHWFHTEKQTEFLVEWIKNKQNKV